MGLFGAKNRRVRELTHEVLKPLGIDADGLTDESRKTFEGHMRRVVERDQDGELYRRQDGWRKGE